MFLHRNLSDIIGLSTADHWTHYYKAYQVDQRFELLEETFQRERFIAEFRSGNVYSIDNRDRELGISWRCNKCNLADVVILRVLPGPVSGLAQIIAVIVVTRDYWV